MTSISIFIYFIHPVRAIWRIPLGATTYCHVRLHHLACRRRLLCRYSIATRATGGTDVGLACEVFDLPPAWMITIDT